MNLRIALLFCAFLIGVSTIFYMTQQENRVYLREQEIKQAMKSLRPERSQSKSNKRTNKQPPHGLHSKQSAPKSDPKLNPGPAERKAHLPSLQAFQAQLQHPRMVKQMQSLGLGQATHFQLLRSGRWQGAYRLEIEGLLRSITDRREGAYDVEHQVRFILYRDAKDWRLQRGRVEKLSPQALYAHKRQGQAISRVRRTGPVEVLNWNLLPEEESE